MSKISSKRCELVKLCHINRSGPFFETQGSFYVSNRIAVFRRASPNGGVEC